MTFFPNVPLEYPPVAHANCLHCTKWKYIQGRGLCNVCHRNMTIRIQYAPQRGCRDAYSEPTAEQLEALIAERMKDLPEWWHESQDRDNPPKRVRKRTKILVSARKKR